MKTVLVAVALFFAYVQAKPLDSQDVLEISKSNMMFKCQVAAVEESPGKLALKGIKLDISFQNLIMKLKQLKTRYLCAVHTSMLQLFRSFLKKVPRTGIEPAIFSV